MKLAISNIGWVKEQDKEVYQFMHTYGFEGLEIAPTRIIPDQPYDHLEEAAAWSRQLLEEEKFVVPSMQSIWFGRNEKIFGSEEERQTLLEYTKKAIDFAQVTGCKNLVFGCPRNRTLPDGMNDEDAVAFFRELGEYALAHDTVIGMEANPPMYNTNYINDTASAIELIHRVDSKGFLLNLDVGTMIANEESLDVLKGNLHLVNHVHVSEPGLKPVEARELHEELAHVLINQSYNGYISIEMGKVDNLSVIEERMKYVRRVFRKG